MLRLPWYNNGQGVLFSGNVGGCMEGTCDPTKNCGPEPCGVSGSVPNIAEFTFQKNDIDFYDISFIGGLNLAMEMGPVNGSSRPANPYWCGNPGATQPITAVGACNYEFSYPSIDYLAVTTSNVSCETTADCSALQGTVCGTSYDPTRVPMVKKTCGTFFGYWSDNGVCGKTQNQQGAPFDCNVQLPAPENNLLLGQLYGCVGASGSCYSTGADPNHCCGCVNWDEVGVKVPPAPETSKCVAQNPIWLDDVLPRLHWLKAGCPTVYTYPYDDMSSTFVCSEMEGVNNVADYYITFCPQGAQVRMTDAGNKQPNGDVPITATA